ncbi:translocation/assembly module TamB domain-containing protein [Qipengyuania sp. JC766]|uniref:translocation/assembly module TamB domain-containing protein n=1 Tax=Qipengyuania sp. JC766 TaxID=3232139 RepID=UPI00345AC9AE
MADTTIDTAGENSNEPMDTVAEDTAPASARRKRPLPVRALRWLVFLLLGLVAIVAIALVVLNSPIGKRFIADEIAKVAPASGLRVEIGRIEGSIYGQAELYDVILSDPEGRFLTIPRAELDWRPLSWLTSGLDVRKLVAYDGVLSRTPQLLPGDPDAPILPDFDIRVDRFELDNFTIAAGVIDDEAHRADLIAKADIRDGRAMLQSSGEFGQSDRYVFDFESVPDDDTFDLALDYFAPADGVLTGLAGLDDDYRATIRGDGSWSAWNGYFLARRGEERLAAGRLTHREGLYRISGQVAPDDFVEGLAADALGEQVSIGAVGTLEDSILDGGLAIGTDALRAVGSGVLDLADNSADNFTIDAQLLDAGLLGPDLRLEGARAEAVIDGSFRDLSVAHTLELDRFVAGEIVTTDVVQSGTVTYDGARWTLPLDASVGRIDTGNAYADPRLVNGTATGTIVYTGQEVLSDDLRIRFPDASAQLALRGDIAAGAYAIAGPINLQGFDLQNVGVVNGNAKIRFRIGTNVPWSLRANFAARVPRVTNATLANVAGPDIRTSGALSLGGAEPIVFDNVRVNAAKLQLALNGRIVGSRTTIAGRGRHTEYGPFTVEAALADDGPRAVLVLANPYPAADLRDVRVAIAPSREGFLIETEGQSLLGAFDGNLELVAPENGPTRIAIERFNVWRTTIMGDLVLGDSGVDGGLALRGGGLNGSVGLATRDGGQGFVVDLTASNATFPGATPIRIGSADIDARGFFRGETSTINGTARASGFEYGNFSIAQMSARAEVTDGRGNFDANLAGRQGSRYALQLQGQFAPERIALVARGSYAGRDISMPRRAVLTPVEGGYALAPTQINFAGGAIVASGTFGDATDLELGISRMPLSLADLAVPDLGLGGTVSGIVDYQSSGNGPPTGSARVKVNRLSRSGLVLTSQPIDVALVGNLTASRLDMRAVISENGQRRGRLQGRITGLPAAGDLPTRLQQGDLFAQLRYGGNASALWRLAAIEAFDVTGPVSIAADVTGTLNNPRINGSVSSDSLRLQSGLSGTDITDGTLRGRFSGARLSITRFSGATSNGGRVTGSGTVDLSNLGSRGPSLDIKIAARNARLLNAAGLDATVTGPLRVVSNGVGGTLAGRLTVDRASWKLGVAAEAAELPQIKTTEINTPANYRGGAAASAPWRYLIDAYAPSRIDVDGMGLDSEWSATVRVRGTTDEMRLGGQAEVVRGDYTFAGTRFELTRGVIRFDESGPIDPRLDILAETEKDGTQFSVDIGGTAQQPEIAFNSVPSYPQEEILARLLFGGSITNLSATDALQLGAAVASLQGGGGMDPINQLRTAVGLDRLRIVSADPVIGRGTSIALGKNIGRRFYVEIITDGRGYSATEAEFRVTSWLSLLASVSSIGRESIVGEYRRDY